MAAGVTPFFLASSTMIGTSARGDPVLPRGEYAMTCTPAAAHASRTSCCGSHGWFSIWFTAGVILACGRSSSRYFLLYCSVHQSLAVGAIVVS